MTSYERYAYEMAQKKREIQRQYTQKGKDLLTSPVTSKYVLLKGNNHGAVNRVMASRCCWERIQPQGNTLFDFKWTPCSQQINYEFLGKHGEKHLVNHFEHHV